MSKKVRCQVCGRQIIRPTIPRRLFENSPPIWVGSVGPFCRPKCVRSKLKVKFNRLTGYEAC